MMKLKEVMTFAIAAHQGQMYGGYPYSYHLQNVVDQVNKLYPESPKLKQLVQIAWLHDVIEDTWYTAQDLLNLGIDPEVVLAVLAVTKIEGEDYLMYLNRVKRNKMAKKVKLADTMANLSQSIKESQSRRVTKYATQVNLLGGL